jgi:hypothetical protein
MRKVAQTTPDQRSTIEILRILFGEKGYGICPVAEEFRRHELDFVAYQHALHSRFVVVRVTPKGWVSVTPFVMKGNFSEAREHMGKSFPARVFWSKKQLFLPKEEHGWKRYFPPEIQEEWRLVA